MEGSRASPRSAGRLQSGRRKAARSPPREAEDGLAPNQRVSATPTVLVSTPFQATTEHTTVSYHLQDLSPRDPGARLCRLLSAVQHAAVPASQPSPLLLAARDIPPSTALLSL
jgi:hypothetical protein